MGLFSWECRGCSHSILGPFVLTKTTMWMNEAVVLAKDGSVLIGDYDGYGRIKGMEIHDFNGGGEPEMWHHSCWMKSGSPKYSGPSPAARDQGHFIMEHNYDHEDPLVCGKLPEKKHENVHSILRPPKKNKQKGRTRAR